MPVPPALVKSWMQHTAIQQSWLCRLSKLLQYVNQDDNRQHGLANADHVVDNVDARDEIDYINRFPKWDWHHAEILYDWNMENAPCRPRDWGYSDAMWIETLNFFQTLKWRRAEDTFVSVYELGIYFWLRVKSPPPEVIKGFSGRFINVVNWIRHFMRVVKKQKIQLFPILPLFWPENVVGPVYSSLTEQLEGLGHGCHMRPLWFSHVLPIACRSVAVPLMRGTGRMLIYHRFFLQITRLEEARAIPATWQ